MALAQTSGFLHFAKQPAHLRLSSSRNEFAGSGKGSLAASGCFNALSALRMPFAQRRPAGTAAISATIKAPNATDSTTASHNRAMSLASIGQWPPYCVSRQRTCGRKLDYRSRHGAAPLVRFA